MTPTSLEQLKFWLDRVTLIAMAVGIALMVIPLPNDAFRLGFFCTLAALIGNNLVRAIRTGNRTH